MQETGYTQHIQNKINVLTCWPRPLLYHVASLTHISKYYTLNQNRMCEGNVILRNALNISDRQDKTYHALCYTSRGALAGTRYSPHGIKCTFLHKMESKGCLWQYSFVFYRGLDSDGGPGRSSEVERSLIVRWVVGSILNGVNPLSYFSFQPVFHDWSNKGRGMCYPVCGMVHIKEPLLLIDKSSLCGGSGFLFLLSEWSLTICLTPHNRG